MIEQCSDCLTWWVNCPCCDVSFCPSCGKLEDEEIEEGED
jgi:hypothetical protein